MPLQSNPPRRVLFVNDSPDEREMYARWFRSRGCCTLQAANADDGYRMAVELAPAVVVTGVKLVGSEDGLALTRRLKNDTQTKHTPVVILSGCAFLSDDDAARHAGCDLVVRKPCLPDVLASEINRLLGSG